MNYLKTYQTAITKIAETGDATEFSYRTQIHHLLQSTLTHLNLPHQILQEPSRINQIGAPDFRITAQNGGVIGYVECKNLGANLRAPKTTDQIARYRALSPNILLTDSQRWLLLRDTTTTAQADLTTPTRAQQTALTDLLQKFLTAPPEKIGDAKRLAAALANRCLWLRQGLGKSETHADPNLQGLLKCFRDALDPNLTYSDFADTFAQTLVYSLLLAKLNSPLGKKLDLYTINRTIPQNFALIREIARFMQTLDEPPYETLNWVVTDILAIINNIDAPAVTQTMTYKKSKAVTDQDDPYLYFYEHFLAAYNAKIRERRGVYYTPPPVVRFIVRAVDDLLKTEFALPHGFAESNRVTALDFAAGTGTFMLEIMRTTLAGTTPARRDLLTRQHLLQNLYGFELLIAPYAIAHLKLSQYLADQGTPLQKGERIQIYLTNTLEAIKEQINIPALPVLAAEANRAQQIKKQPILVIIGNPPYSVVSQNTYTEVDAYKPRDDTKEHNLKMLQDDYVKFIRFAQRKIDQVERGIVAVITNHSFLDNPTFRGMRQSLLETFHTLYFLDLHGNAKKQPPANIGKDENVFDIQQGVAISLLIKNPSTTRKGIFHANLYGERATKYQTCETQTITDIKWKKLTPTPPFHFFIPYDHKSAKKYRELHSLKDIFAAQGSGITTHRDHFAFAFTANEIKTRIRDLLDKGKDTETLREKYQLKDTRDWSFIKARAALQKSHSFAEFLRPCLCRPFDHRYCYYGRETMELPRTEIMGHLIAGDNLGLVSVRQARSSNSWRHCFVTKDLIERCYISNKSGEVNYLFPLYRYDKIIGDTTRQKVENLTPEFRHWINNRYGNHPTPENILAYIYATLHSPDYRKRYAEFLRIDFPRIPFPDTLTEFTRLAKIGNQLINAHLLRNHHTGNLATYTGTTTNHTVERVHYDPKTHRLHINKTNHFAPIPPEIYNFQIGGYQPLDKYLKSRKNRPLTIDQTHTLHHATNAIAFTLQKMKEL